MENELFTRVSIKREDTNKFLDACREQYNIEAVEYPDEGYKLYHVIPKPGCMSEVNRWLRSLPFVTIESGRNRRKQYNEYKRSKYGSISRR